MSAIRRSARKVAFSPYAAAAAAQSTRPHRRSQPNRRFSDVPAVVRFADPCVTLAVLPEEEGPMVPKEQKVPVPLLPEKVVEQADPKQPAAGDAPEKCRATK